MKQDIVMSLIPLSKEDKDLFPFQVSDGVIISSSDIFFEGLRGQEATVIAIGRDYFSDMKVVRVIAPYHTVPNYPADFEWEIVPELLEKLK